MSTSISTIHAQERTLPVARRKGEAWTLADLDLVVSYTGRDEDLAKDLGRTLYAIYAIRHALTEGRASREGRDTTRRAASRVLPYDLGFVGSIPDEW